MRKEIDSTMQLNAPLKPCANPRNKSAKLTILYTLTHHSAINAVEVGLF